MKPLCWARRWCRVSPVPQPSGTAGAARSNGAGPGLAGGNCSAPGPAGAVRCPGLRPQLRPTSGHQQQVLEGGLGAARGCSTATSTGCSLFWGVLGFFTCQIFASVSVNTGPVTWNRVLSPGEPAWSRKRCCKLSRLQCGQAGCCQPYWEPWLPVALAEPVRLGTGLPGPAPAAPVLLPPAPPVSAPGVAALLHSSCVPCACEHHLCPCQEALVLSPAVHCQTQFLQCQADSWASVSSGRDPCSPCPVFCRALEGLRHCYSQQWDPHSCTAPYGHGWPWLGAPLPAGPPHVPSACPSSVSGDRSTVTTSSESHSRLQE